MRTIQPRCYSGRLLNSAKHPHARNKRRTQTVLHLAAHGEKDLGAGGKASKKSCSRGQRGLCQPQVWIRTAKVPIMRQPKRGRAGVWLVQPPAAKYRCRGGRQSPRPYFLKRKDGFPLRLSTLGFRLRARLFPTAALGCPPPPPFATSMILSPPVLTEASRQEPSYRGPIPSSRAPKFPSICSESLPQIPRLLSG